MNTLNIYLIFIVCILFFFILLEIYRYKNILSPAAWVLSNIFLQYIIGAFYLVNLPKILPDINVINTFIKESLNIIFVQIISFSSCYFLFSFRLEKKKSISFHFQIIKWKELTYFTTLGLLGAFALFSLIYQEMYAASAYSSMRGMGWANWLLIIFLVPHCFLYIGSADKKSRLY